MKAHVFISGFVQGVGFRHFIRKEAGKLGLSVLVQNLPASPAGGQGGPDGRVEALLEGPKDKIDKMIALCRKGPFLAKVEDVVVEWVSV